MPNQSKKNNFLNKASKTKGKFDNTKDHLSLKFEYVLACFW
jgi:hypothetical protein